MVVTLRVRLQETATLLLYQQENTSVCTLHPEAQEYIREWNTYTQKLGGQTVRTREVTSQTLLKYNVDKTTQKSAVQFKDTGSWATQWDMHDEAEKMKLRGRPSTRLTESMARRRSQPALYFYTGASTPPCQPYKE
nr:uncharacterized protein LOC128694559 [Cherax quadricarinatus]